MAPTTVVTKSAPAKPWWSHLYAQVLIGIAIVVFALMHVIPGDPARVLLGDDATAEAVAQLRATLGLDQPWPVQLMHYFARLASGDFGRSMFLTDSVANLILARLPATLEIAILAVLISVALGVGLGVAAAVRQGSPVDVACMMFAQLGVSMPVYWLGIMLVLTFAVQLNWLPAIGRGPAMIDAVNVMAVPKRSSRIGLTFRKNASK